MDGVRMAITLLYKNITHALFSKGVEAFVVWEMDRDKDRLLYRPIASFFDHTTLWPIYYLAYKLIELSREK